MRTRSARRLPGIACALLAAAAAAGAVRGEDEAWIARVVEPGPESAAPALGLGDYAEGSWRPGGGRLGSVVPWEWEGDDEPPPGADAEDLADWLRGAARAAPRQGLEAHVRRRVVVEVEVVGGGVAWRGTVVARSGRRGSAASVRDLDLLAEYDPELACDNSFDGSRPSVIGDPEVRRVHDGHAADVRAWVLPDGGVALEAIVQWGRLAEPVPSVATEAKHLGDMDAPRVRGGLAVLSGAVAPGEPLEARVTVDGEATTVRLRPRIDGPADPAEPGFAIRRLDAGLVALGAWAPGRRRGEGWECPVGRPLPFVGDGPAPVGVDALGWILCAAAGHEDLHVDRWGRVWVAGDAARWRRLRAALDPLLAEAARTVRLEVRALAGGAEVARAEVPSLVGRAALLRVGEERAFLWDSEPEVG